MIDWELDNNPESASLGDLVIGDFIDHTVTGIDALVQRLKIRLLVFLGEWFLDETRGVPYFQEILEKGTSYDQISDAIKLVIAQTEDVKKINYFTIKDSEITNREIIIAFGVSSTFGDAQVENFSIIV